MRKLVLGIVSMILISGCTPSANSSTNVAPAQQPTKVSTPDRQPSSAVDGIIVTVDGKTFDITGDVQVTRQSASGVNMAFIGKNPRPSALIGGNGTLLELQTMPGKTGFSASDIGTLTFTVWKGVEFSYTSMAAMPGRPIEGLSISQSSGKLSGSFESSLNGTLGKMRARIDFGVPLPN